jgi:hypothetical protein
VIRLTLGDILYHDRPGDGTPAGHLPLSALPLLILVGMTGAGKTTTVRALSNADPSVGFLPERRDLADEIIIPAMLAGQPGSAAPADRIGRMALTRRFRERHPGGFSHILANLTVASIPGVGRLLFDGLRGPEEVSHALANLPLARMAVLDVPDPVRLRRLLCRRDRFDVLAASGKGFRDTASLFGEGSDFSEGEREALLEGLPAEAYTPEEVRDKIRIIAEERKNYRMGEVAAMAAGPERERMLFLSDPGLNPDAVAAMISKWWWPT